MSEQAEDIIKDANRELDEGSEPPMTIQEYVQELLDDPSIARTAHQYLLDAIDYFGTRTVFERGEEKERYCFFDDPANNGEHSVLGNTDTLNSFVNDLRVIAGSDERMQKIILFSGPTATGKSELKRCIINGLREYSKTDEGRRYTCDWNITTMNKSTDGLAYSGPNEESLDEADWYRSPVQANPFSVLPRGVRRKVSERAGRRGYLPLDMGLDPFSEEAYQKLKKNYEHSDSGELFSAITDPKHFRVRRYVVDETQGIGILTAEDDGSVKERLLGSWMPSMLQELDSRGRKDPRAFSYDGVLSQGNCGVTVVEDATKHADVLLHLLNIPDEGHAKIDKEIGFDVDTVPIFISNPDLVSQQLQDANPSIPLEQIHGADPLKAVKRRLFQYSFKYLTGYSNESELLRKEIQGYTDELKNGEVAPQDSLHFNGTEFSPHVIEAVAMYNVVTRLTTDNLPEGLDLVEKALLYDRGYIETENGRKSIEEFDIDDIDADGEFGIPVTYSRDILRAIVHSDDEEVYLPDETLDEIVEGISEAPVFGDKEAEQFEDRVTPVREYVNERQQQDVIEAILSDRQATEDAVSEYVDNLYEWEDENEDEYDEYLLKDFEMKHLGTTESEYDGQEPKESVVELRNDRIIKPLNRYHWRQRSNEFESGDAPLKEVPVLSSLLGEYSWTDVFTTYENIEPINWENPPENTQTAEIKEKCIENMVEMFDYSEQSARMTSEKVFVENKEELLETKEEVA